MSEPRIMRSKLDETTDLFQLFIGKKVMDDLIIDHNNVTPVEFKQMVDQLINECATIYREGKYNAQES
jgi:hypothetical protein